MLPENTILSTLVDLGGEGDTARPRTKPTGTGATVPFPLSLPLPAPFLCRKHPARASREECGDGVGSDRLRSRMIRSIQVFRLFRFWILGGC
ncbi:hypothetical protein BHM03_00018565 [Ensete ventricosum]|nr:hypothetical protein BHM03_00018565 [Ensete ventricosum]